MKRILLVSPNLSFGFGLNPEYDLLEERPRAGWTLQPERLSGIDAVVLDLHDVTRTTETVQQARTASFDGPILVVSEPGLGWSDLESDAAIRVLELPVTGSGVNRVLDEMLVSRTVPRARKTARHVAAVETGVQAGTDVQDPGVRTSPSDPGAAIPAPRPSSDVWETVRRLHASVDKLLSVSDVSASLLGDALAATTAEAGAVLVPDGCYWRVTAGVAIRHLEWRLALDAESWLIDETATQRHGVIIEGTDIARQRLAGVPLASWDNIMAAPIADRGIVVIVARRAQPAFASPDLQALVQAAEAHDTSLTQALELRELARSLKRFADVEMLD